MEKDGQRAIAGVHSHLPETGDYITPTDIATLMLYQQAAGWEQYYVMSSNYVSIWNCKKNQLTTLMKEAWDNIYSEDRSGTKKGLTNADNELILAYINENHLLEIANYT